MLVEDRLKLLRRGRCPEFAKLQNLHQYGVVALDLAQVVQKPLDGAARHRQLGLLDQCVIVLVVGLLLEDRAHDQPGFGVRQPVVNPLGQPDVLVDRIDRPAGQFGQPQPDPVTLLQRQPGSLLAEPQVHAGAVSLTTSLA